MPKTNEFRIEEHKKFWRHEKTEGLLAGFRIGDYFFATHYQAAKPLLVNGQKISPDMIDVDSFLEDYEKQFQLVDRLDQTAFWTAEPYTGIPWMEAFWGSEIIAGEYSCVAHHFVKGPEELESLRFSMDNPWVEKYFEFVKKLNTLSAGRFPVGEPIMRGQGDTTGALMGQTELILAMYEEPEMVKAFLERMVDSFLAINEEMHRLNGDFLGGSGMGFYHLWAPGKCVWFQEDICALLSPDLYREFFLENERRICSVYDYSLTHQHPSAFYNLDNLLSNEGLKVVEINKDAGGPGIREMLPQFKKVLDKGKKLQVWGDLDEEEIKIVYDNLPPEGICFNLIEKDIETAQRVSDYLNGIHL
ncbi:hypothetical protein AGMMS50268_16080 [Spirochaetia bacterium]|nr:hypothetical protein AGMMS50268_16080 [Spirochaetia bacterium]